MRKYKLSGDATIPVAGLRGLVVGFAVIIILFAIATFLVSSGKIPESSMRMVTSICVFLGSLAGSLIAAKSHAHRRLIVGIGLSFVMFLICFLVSVISASAGFPSKWHLILLITFIAGGAVGSVFAAGSPMRRR